MSGFHLCIDSHPPGLAAWRAVLRRKLRPIWAQHKKSLWVAMLLTSPRASQRGGTLCLCFLLPLPCPRGPQLVSCTRHPLHTAPYTHRHPLHTAPSAHRHPLHTAPSAHGTPCTRQPSHILWRSGRNPELSLRLEKSWGRSTAPQPTGWVALSLTNHQATLLFVWKRVIAGLTGGPEDQRKQRTQSLSNEEADPH